MCSFFHVHCKAGEIPLRFNISRFTGCKYSGTARSGDWWIKEHDQNSPEEGAAAITSPYSLHFLCVCLCMGGGRGESVGLFFFLSFFFFFFFFDV